MNNAPDYSIHRTTGAGEISGQRMVTNQKEDRRQGPGKRKGRPRHQDVDDADGVKVDLSDGEQSDPSDPSDLPNLSDRPDQDDSQDTQSVDCLA
jgi:hypothetical protein